MTVNHGFHSMNSNDNLDPADRLKIERSIYAKTNPNITQLATLPLEQLQTMREESVEHERVIFQNIQTAAGAWEAQAAATLVFDNAIEYAKMPPVKHTSNEWGKLEKSVPKSWDVTWGVRTNSPNRYSDKIAGQTNKRYTDKSEAEKYLAGRIKAYAHLFTEISPPIPTAYADTFRVNGHLLAGYTLEHEEFYPPERAAEISGVSDIDEKINAILQKERENMNEPLNIQLSTHEQNVYGSSRVWLKLPATEEQLNAALARMGVPSAEQGKDLFIVGVETNLPAIERMPLENLQSAGINGLNYLAAQLEAFDDKQTARLNAIIGIMPDPDNVQNIIGHAHNIGFHEHYPDIHNHTQLGAHIFEKSGLIQIPEEWAEAVDLEKLGRIAAEKELGIFTEQGYIVESGEEWKSLMEIPQEYRITTKVDYDTTPAQNAAIVPTTPTEQSKSATIANATTTTNTPTNTAPQTSTTDTTATDPPKTPTAPAAVIPLVLTSDNPRDKMKEITGKLEAGIKGIIDSEQYKTYLKTFAKFHNYSLNNCILIAMQKPDASHVGGFNFWRDDMKRPVRKGEKGMKIIAPSPFKTKKMVDAVDKNGKPVFKDGKRVKEEQEITVPAFRVATVFDVSQTDGEPLPTLGVSELSGSVDKYKEFFTALEKTSPVPIGFEAITSGAKGYYQQMEKRIAINEGMSELQNLKTAIHEIAHSRLHAIDTEKPLKGQELPDRRTREVEAESIAYTVCQHYGLDTSDYSFGYVATWSGDKELDTLKSSLETIRKEAAAIITEVDKHFAELAQDMEQTADKTIPQQDDTFTIYQLKDGNETRDIRFMPLDTLPTAPDAENYNNVYTAPLKQDDTLDKIYAQFNQDRPQDFKGHSLSVSDVIVINHNGKETAHYVDSAGFKELPNFTPPTQDKAAPPIDLKIVADYFQNQNNAIQAADPNKEQGQAAFSMGIKRLEQANERIPADHPQLKALLSNAAQSPDLPTLKERMNTLHSEFIQHYSTAVQNSVDMSGKAEPKAPAATTHNADTPPAPKTPTQGENVAAIEAKVKAGEAVNLSDVSDAMKKDKQAAQSTPTAGKTTQATTKGKSGTRSYQTSKSKTATKDEQPSIKEKIAAGKKELSGQKSTPSKTANKNKNNGLGD